MVSILSVSVDPREMLRAESALALAPLCGDLNLPWPYILMWVFKNGIYPSTSSASLFFLLEPGQT